MCHAIMKTIVAPTAADPWPKIHPVTSFRPTGGRLTLEVPGLSEAPLLAALSREIHLEMRAAGEWAARMGEPGDNRPFGPTDFHRLSVENAARLLAIYTALHGCASYLSAHDLNPEALKASASRTYATGLRCKQARRQDQDKPISPPASTQH